MKKTVLIIIIYVEESQRALLPGGIPKSCGNLSGQGSPQVRRVAGTETEKKGTVG